MMLASITEEGIVVKELIRKNPFAVGAGWLARTAEAALSRLQESRQRRREAKAEAAWRRDFRPHAVILTERDRPVMLAAMMFTGDQRFIFFEKGADPATLCEQTRKALPDEVSALRRAAGLHRQLLAGPRRPIRLRREEDRGIPAGVSSDHRQDGIPRGLVRLPERTARRRPRRRDRACPAGTPQGHAARRIPPQTGGPPGFRTTGRRGPETGRRGGVIPTRPFPVPPDEAPGYGRGYDRLPDGSDSQA